MALNDLNKNAISFKKLSGKAHTQQGFSVSEEGINTNVQQSYSTVFANRIEPLPVTNSGLTSLYSTNNIVERVKFVLDLVTDTEIGTNQSQAYRLKLPSDYNVSGNLHPIFTSGDYLNESLGRLQIVPSVLGQVKPDGSTEYDGILYQTNGSTIIPKFDSINWYLDRFNGILFVQDPPAGYDVSVARPGFFEGFLYIGEYMNDILDVLVVSSGVTGTTATNVGGAAGIFKDKIAQVIRLKSIKGVNGIAATGSTDNVIISITGSTANLNATNGLTITGDDIRLGGTLTGASIFTDNRVAKIGLEYAADYTGLTNNSLVHKLWVERRISGFTGSTNFLTKTAFGIWSGTTLPNYYLSKANFNSYSGSTLTNINTRLLTSTFNSWTGTTLPASYLSKAGFSIYSGFTNTRLGVVEANYITGTTDGLTTFGKRIRWGGDLGVTNVLITAPSGLSNPSNYRSITFGLISGDRLIHNFSVFTRRGIFFSVGQSIEKKFEITTGGTVFQLFGPGIDAAGDTYYNGGNNNNLARRAIGNTGDVYVVGSDGFPMWTGITAISGLTGSLSGITFVNNGLRKVGTNTARLGGGLIEDTLISGSTRNITFSLNSYTFGTRTGSVGSASLSVGLTNDASGTGSISIGEDNISNATHSVAFGKLVVAAGTSSFGGGLGTVNTPVRATGQASFNYSENTLTGVTNIGTKSSNSAIVGGKNHNIETGNARAAIIGGQSISLTGSSYADYVAVPNLAIWSTPATASDSAVLTWNSVTKKITTRTIGTIGVSSIGTINGQTKSSNGAVINTGILFMQTADLTNPGLVSTAASGQTFGGPKTFASVPTFSAFSGGSVLYTNSSGLLQQSNTNFNFDGSLKTLNISHSTNNVYEGVTITNNSNQSSAISRIRINNNINSLAALSVYGTGHTTHSNIATLATNASALIIYTAAENPIRFVTNFNGQNTDRVRITANGMYIGGSVNPSARLHISGGTTTIAPLKINSGPLRGTPDDGSIENFGGHLWYTAGSTRYQLDRQAGDGTVTGLTGNKYAIRITSTNITLLNSDYVILVTTTGGTRTITLPSSPLNGQAYKIKDSGGNAATNNITISGNGKNIEGSSTATINTAFGGVEIVFSTTLNQWYILSFNQ
jgi:hypothetical protein